MDCNPPGRLSIGFPRQEYWCGLPFPSPGDLPNCGDWIWVSCLEGRFFTTESPGKYSKHCSLYTQDPFLLFFWAHRTPIFSGENKASFHLLWSPPDPGDYDLSYQSWQSPSIRPVMGLRIFPSSSQWEIKEAVISLSQLEIQSQEKKIRGLPGGPVVKTLSFHCRGTQIRSPVQELRSHMPHGLVEKKKRENLLPLPCPLWGPGAWRSSFCLPTVKQWAQGQNGRTENQKKQDSWWCIQATATVLLQL